MAPTALLAARRRNGLTVPVCQQVRCYGADVIGNVEVFGKPANSVVCLRQAGTSFEGQVRSEGGFNEGCQGLDNPDVLFQQRRPASAETGGDLQGIPPVIRGERLKRNVSHWPPLRSPALQSRRASMPGTPPVHPGLRRIVSAQSS